MPFQPTHTGLFLPLSFLESSRAAAESKPLIAAWTALDSTPTDDVLLQLLWLSYRWRGLGDTEAGQKALMLLHSLDEAAIFARPDAERAGAGPSLVGLAHVVEMLRSHPAVTPALMQTFRHWTTETASLMTPFVPSSAWRVTAQLARGVVLDDKTIFEEGVTWFEEAIANLHPEGYLREAVESKGAHTYADQFSIACALALAAEIATNVGVDLWAYANRGVSAKTAAAYVMFYLYYPEKWRWSEPGVLTAETMLPIIKDQAAFLEIVHARSPLRSIDILLHNHRPFISFTGGGMTTLVYGAPPPRATPKPWWQVWR